MLELSIGCCVLQLQHTKKPASMSQFFKKITGKLDNPERVLGFASGSLIEFGEIEGERRGFHGTAGEAVVKIESFCCWRDGARNIIPAAL